MLPVSVKMTTVASIASAQQEARRCGMASGSGDGSEGDMAAMAVVVEAFSNLHILHTRHFTSAGSLVTYAHVLL